MCYVLAKSGGNRRNGEREREREREEDFSRSFKITGKKTSRGKLPITCVEKTQKREERKELI